MKNIFKTISFLSIATFFLWIAPNAYAITCGFGSDLGNGNCRGFITTIGAGTFTVPSDWGNASNTIEVIGGGGGGASGPSHVGVGGGGGGYSEAKNVNLTIGNVVGLSVGSSSMGVNGLATSSTFYASSTWFCSDNSGNCTGTFTTFGSSVLAGAFGSRPAIDGATTTGGITAGAVGNTKFAGGNGGDKGNDADGAGSGGGAGGPNGAGCNGNGPRSTSSGAGGGGAGGGSCTYGGAGSGSNTAGAGGTAQDGTAGGAAGTNGAAGGNGSHGSGGGGAFPGTVPTAGIGGNGIEWDATHGAGGGGGGGCQSCSAGGGNAGTYGGGGGGGGWHDNQSGNGAQGIIVITYTPASTVSAFFNRLMVNVGNRLKVGFGNLFKVN